MTRLPSPLPLPRREEVPDHPGEPRLWILNTAQWLVVGLVVLRVGSLALHEVFPLAIEDIGNPAEVMRFKLMHLTGRFTCWGWVITLAAPALCIAAIGERGALRRGLLRTAGVALLPAIAFGAVQLVDAVIDLPNERVRREAAVRIIEHGEPIVAAIRAHETETGWPPNALEDLVPDYLEAIPDTEMEAAPAYEYWTLGSHPMRWIMEAGVDPDLHPEIGYFSVRCSKQEGLLPSDRHVQIERIGDWLYMHSPRTPVTD